MSVGRVEKVGPVHSFCASQDVFVVNKNTLKRIYVQVYNYKAINKTDCFKFSLEEEKILKHI